MQNCAWITTFNCALTFGGFYQKKDSSGTSHLEYLIDVSREISNSVYGISNLSFSDIYGAKTRQKISILGESLPTNVLLKQTVQSGGIAAFLPPANSSYLLFLRGDAAGGTLGFTSTVICTKAYNNTTWTIKAETVNTEESMPSAVYPVTYTIAAGSNNLIFNSPSAEFFDIQVKITNLMSGSNAF